MNDEQTRLLSAILDQLVYMTSLLASIESNGIAQAMEYGQRTNGK